MDDSVAEGDDRTFVVLESKSTNTPLVTLFSVPKPFDGLASIHQCNAVASWMALGPSVDIVLLGDEPGVAENARALGVRHVPRLARNHLGTPLISSAFELAREHSTAPYLMYCNCDVILTGNTLQTIKGLAMTQLADRFVAFGNRIDVTLNEKISVAEPVEFDTSIARLAREGQRSTLVCKEYFIFPRHLLSEVPPFAIGRGNWDNWIVYSCRKCGIPVINVSDTLTAIHQRHDYRHNTSNRFKSYVSGEEARENEILADGKHIIAGSCATWRFTERGLRRIRFSDWNPDFWLDLHRFVPFVAELLFSRKN